MPKNKGKGGKNRRRGKNEGEEKRELIYKDEGQEYAKVIRMLGNGRLEAACIDGKTRQCHIRGKMRKKVWVAAGDIILLSLREYQDDKADVIVKYSADEARALKSEGHLPDSIAINEGVAEGGEGEDGAFEFGDAGDSSGDDDDDSSDDGKGRAAAAAGGAGAGAAAAGAGGAAAAAAAPAAATTVTAVAAGPTPGGGARGGGGGGGGTSGGWGGASRVGGKVEFDIDAI